MIRTLLVSFFMSLYILIVGPPLLVYTLTHTQSGSALSRRHRRRDVFRARRWRARACHRNRAYSRRCVSFCRESHQHSGCSRDSRCDSTSHCHPSEGITFSLAYRGTSVPAGALHSHRTRWPGLRHRQPGQSDGRTARRAIFFNLSGRARAARTGGCKNSREARW